MSDVRYTPEEERLRKTISERVAQAFHEAKEADPKRDPAWLAQVMGVSHSSIYRILNASPGTDPDAIQIWRLAQATKKPFGWFAGEAVTSSDAAVLAAERAEATIRVIHAAAAELLADLAAIRQTVRDDMQVAGAGAAERGVGRASAGRRKKRAEKVGEPVAPAREAAG